MLNEIMHRKVEKQYNVYDKASKYIAEQFNKPYLEALIDAGEMLFYDEDVIECTEEQRRILRSILEKAQSGLSKEERRRAFQLAVLQGMKEVAVPGTGITPDTVCMFSAYMIKQLTEKPSVVWDPAAGTGNLLTCVLNEIDQAGHVYQAWGTEVDPLLIRLAYANANLQHISVELMHQDALKEVQIPPPDLVVTDLPVGIYPNGEIAKTYTLHAEGHQPYTHHLLLEKCIRMSRDGAYLLFIIPNTLFTEPGSSRLRQLVNDKAYVQSVLQLPANLFQEGSIQKSLLILQTKGHNIKKPRQALMAQLPSFSDAGQMNRTLEQIKNWVEVNK